MKNVGQTPLFIEVVLTKEHYPNVEECMRIVKVDEIAYLERTDESHTALTITFDGAPPSVLYIDESLEHFAKRMNNAHGAIVLLPPTEHEKAVKAESGLVAASDYYYHEAAKALGYYTVTNLTDELMEECREHGIGGSLWCVEDTAVSVCVRHNGDRTDCRISHLESKDGHITIVCDEEDDE